MDLREMFARIQSGEVAAHSELGTRDEAKQSKNFTARISKLKIKTNIKGRALVMKDLVVPFNPFTCEADDTYNGKTPFRPILLVSQSLSQIKSICAENPALAEAWSKRLGKSLDWSAPVTREDYLAFKARDMIKPRIMSYSTVDLNFSGIAGFPNFRTPYTVDPKDLDESNNYLPGVNPLWNQAAVFFYAMLKPQIDKVTAELEKQSANKEQIQSERRAISSRSPVAFVKQTNLVPFLYFPLDEAPRTFDLDQPLDFESCISWLKYNRDKWSSSMAEAEGNDTYDENIDFYDFTIKTPTNKMLKSDGKPYTDDDGIELYQAMTINNTDGRADSIHGTTMVDGKTIPNSQLFANVWEAAARYFAYSQEESMKEGGGETFEKLMAASSRFRPIESILDKFLMACNHVFVSQFAGSPYFTEEIKMANSEFFLAMSPDNALALAAADEDDIAQAQAKQQANIKAILATAREGEDADDEESVLNLGGEEESSFTPVVSE